MIYHGQFNPFIVSRFFSGFFGGVTGVLGPRILVDLFFLHQRGRAFTAFHWCLNLGSVAGPTLSAFISSGRSWTLEFWWTVGLLGFTIICCFLFMHETAWIREPGAVNVPAPEGFFANRFATFFFGSKVTPKSTMRQTVSISPPNPDPSDPVTNISSGPRCCYSLPRCGVACHNHSFDFHACQLRILYCHEFPHTGLPPEASKGWRLWFWDSSKCLL